MTITVTGRAQVSSYLQRLPDQMVKVLRGAGRAGAGVIAKAAEESAPSAEVGDAVIVRTRATDDRIISRVTIKEGWTYSRALWFEYGTAPHFISVADEQRGGKGIRRINTQVREAKGDASLVIGGKYVGKTVFHPGARAHPFLRPALDLNESEAIKTAQQYINARVSRGGIVLTEQDDAE